MLLESKNLPAALRIGTADEGGPAELGTEFEELLHDLDDDFARLALEVESEEFVYCPAEEETILLAAGQTC